MNLYKQGHHIFYQNILFDKVSKFENDDIEFFFLFNDSEAKNSLLNIHKNTIFLNEEESYKLETKKHSFLKYFIRWNLVQKYSKIHQVDEVFLMDFYEQSILPIVLSSFDFKVGGIVFRPYNRLKQIAQKEKSINVWLNVFMKQFLMSLFTLKSKYISNLLILNDIETVDFLQSKFKYPFRFFPDPVNNYSINSKDYDNLRFKYGISETNKIFLVFGALSDVKNIDNLVNACLLLDDHDLQKCTILIMGKGISGNENFLEKLTRLRNKILAKNPKFEFIIEYNFIDEMHHFSIFSQVDFVFLAYKNFYFSSATLSIAAKTSKPVIVPNYGPMCNLAIEFNLGVLVNPDSALDIKNCIAYCLENHNQMKNGIKTHEFCNTFTEENFTRAILL